MLFSTNLAATGPVDMAMAAKIDANMAFVVAFAMILLLRLVGYILGDISNIV